MVSPIDSGVVASLRPATKSERMSWGDGDFNGDENVNAVDASILAAHWGATSEEQTSTPPASPTQVGPLPMAASPARRRLIMPTDRRATTTEQAAAASDAVMARQFGDEPLEQMTPLRQQLAWSHTVARRQSHREARETLGQTELAIDLLLADRQM